MLSRRQFLIGSSAVLAAARHAPCWAVAVDDLAAARVKLYSVYAERLAALAAWCDERKLAGRASQLRSWLPDRLPDRQYLFVPNDFRHPPRAAEGDSSGGGDTAAKEAASRFTALRREQAGALFALAQRAAKQRQPSLACQLATEAAREDLACERAWRFLCYAQYAGGWHTPFEIAQLKAGNVWHERFGWLPRAHVERYERGERFAGGRWLSDRDELRQRGGMKQASKIETEHYLVTSDAGLEEIVALGRQLERLRAVWQQVFTGYLVDESTLPGRLAGGEPLIPATAAKHKVIYYRNRQEYNEALRAGQPQIETTLGIYFADRGLAYFFAGLDQEPGTLYHEATHQLFAESRPIIKDLAERANFWIVEGAACYMESLVDLDGYCTLGGPDAGRMPAARHRRLRDGFYLPLAQLAGLSMHDLQSRDDMARLYTESAGLATFLVDRYPERLSDYLRAVYAGSADSASLARLTGVSDADLDRLYGEYLQALER